MTRLGIGTYAYAWAIGVPGYMPQRPMTGIQFLDRCVALGVNLVQIGDNLPLDQLAEDDLQALIDHATALNLSVEVGTRGIMQDRLHRYIDIAQRFRSPILRVVVDTADHHPDIPEIVHTLRSIVPTLESAGIVLAIENHDRFKARVLADLITQLGSDNIGICLDTVNSFGSLEGPETVVETLGPLTVNLHVKDFQIRRLNHNMGFELIGTPAGTGMLNLPWLMSQLDSCRRNYNAILELWPPPENDIEATINKEHRWAIESISNLRQLIRE